jgi:hypothetical protein
MGTACPTAAAGLFCLPPLWFEKCVFVSWLVTEASVCVAPMCNVWVISAVSKLI